MRVAFVSSYVPRRCGLATFTADLVGAIERSDPGSDCRVAAIHRPGAACAYGPAVRWLIRQGDGESYREAAAAINASGVEAVNVQHEFGLYGVHRDGVYEDHMALLLDALRPQVVTTLHTVLPAPEPWMRDVVRRIAERSAKVVVMVDAAARLLCDAYGTAATPAVIPHGIPAVPRADRLRSRRRLGLDDRMVILTFGLVDPRKGLEYAIDAMPKVVARFPDAIYVVVGQTHPDVVRNEGERYRQMLVERVARLGLVRHVAFVDRYLTQPEIVAYLAATDVYVTPYLDPNQITSGTLAYALGAGRAIVSTPYLHAREALGHGRGLLVAFRDAEAIAEAVDAILGDPGRRRRIERAARAYSRDAAWPVVGRRLLELMRAAVAEKAAGVVA